MKYEIYQIANIKSTDYAFRSWDEAKEKFNINDYRKVYNGDLPQKYILSSIWEKFNINHPADFRGHSLSVSDVVALKKDGNDYWYWYYCDSLGWEEITDLMPQDMGYEVINKRN